MSKPNCYACRYRDTVPGDAHSSCRHPKTGNTGDVFEGLVSMMVGMQAGRPPAGSRELGITANPQGIRMGWFYWPYNYDPAWLLTCNGFEAMEPKSEANASAAPSMKTA